MGEKDHFALPISELSKLKLGLGNVLFDLSRPQLGLGLGLGLGNVPFDLSDPNLGL